MDAKLSELVAKALHAWPALMYHNKRDSRAHAAARLVERGRVRQVNGDQYDVDGKRCHADQDVCECEDHARGAPAYPKVGRLCKHRVAARMARAWGGEQNETLLNLLAVFIGQPWVRLIVEWDYRGPGGERRAVFGFEAPGGKRTRWPGDKSIEFTWPQLRWALGQVDMGLARLPEKGKGYEYLYHVIPGRGIEINETTMGVRGVTEAMQARAEGRKEFETSVALDGNNVNVALSEAAARRIAARRVELSERT